MRANPTQQDVAEHAGVSRALVSLVMRGAPNVSPARREAVLRAVAELGYRPNAAAAHLAARRTHLVGLVLPDLRNPFFGDVGEGVRPAAEGLGYGLLMAAGGHDPAVERAAVERFLELRTDALLLISPLLPAEELERVGRAVPTCVIGRRSDSDALDSIRTDEAAGARLVARHLREAGYRRTVHLDVEPADQAGAERRVGLATELPALHTHSVGMDDDVGHAVDAVLAEGVDAIFAHNDLVALQVVSALRRIGRRVGHEVGVVGYDDTYLAAMDEFSLTSVNQSAAEQGARAVELVHERLAGRQDARHETVAPRLVPRASTTRT